MATVNGFCGYENVLKSNSCNGCITLNIPKTTELYNLKREIFWYVYYIITKLLLFKSSAAQKEMSSSTALEHLLQGKVSGDGPISEASGTHDSEQQQDLAGDCPHSPWPLPQLAGHFYTSLS